MSARRRARMPTEPTLWRRLFFQERSSSEQPGGPWLEAEEDPDRSGSQLGDWELLKRLGRGGMGSVYEALYAGDRARYAVKILSRAHASDPVMVKRFEHEYLVLSRVRHESIIRPFLRGQVGDVRFYAMELVDGQSLHAIVDVRLLDPLLVARIGVQLCHGLAEFHRHGIVHRDIKPANVLLHAGDKVKLIDPGIAKLLPRFYEEGELRTPVGQRIQTQAGIHLGTPGYIAPEVAQGGAPAFSQDIFALGVTLFRLATGQLPYPTIGPIEAGDEPRWSEDLGRRIPGALEEVLRRAVSPSPAMRQPSMLELGEQLQGAVDEIAAEREEVDDAPSSPLPLATERDAESCSVPPDGRDAASAGIEEPAASLCEEPSLPAPSHFSQAALSQAALSQSLPPGEPPTPAAEQSPLRRSRSLEAILVVVGLILAVDVVLRLRDFDRAEVSIAPTVGDARVLEVARDGGAAQDHPPTTAAATPIAGAQEPGRSPPLESTEDLEPTATPPADRVADDGDLDEPPSRSPARLSAPAFRKALEPHRAKIERCTRTLRDAAEVSLALRVRSDGSIASVRLAPDSFLASSCVEEGLRELRFPRAEAASTHTWRLRRPT